MDVSAFDIKDRYNKLTQKQTIYSYYGGLSKPKLDNVHAGIEAILLSDISSKIARKKLFNILIEASQNLYNYYRSTDELKNYSDLFILVNKFKNKIVIITGNFLMTKEIPGIKSRIEMVNAMNEEEVKQLYRGILDFGRPSGEGGGAGLGFVDLARKSGQKLEYNFDKIDEKFSFFTLKITIIE